jgi:hypothetical protein
MRVVKTKRQVGVGGLGRHMPPWLPTRFFPDLQVLASCTKEKKTMEFAGSMSSR